MMTFPNIDPVIIKVGPLAIRWYGMMYLVGFAASYLLIRHLARLRGLALDKEGVSDLLFYGVFGVVLGGRLGYVIFYNPAQYLSRPLDIFAVWQGGKNGWTQLHAVIRIDVSTGVQVTEHRIVGISGGGE